MCLLFLYHKLMGKRTISTLYLKLFFIILFFIYRPLCNFLTNIQNSEILPQNRDRNVFIQNLVYDEICRKGNTFFHIVETFTEYGLAVSPPRRRSRYSASCRRRVRCILQVPSLPSIYNVDCRRGRLLRGLPTKSVVYLPQPI